MKRLASTLLLTLVLCTGSATAEERAARPDESHRSNTLSSTSPGNAAPESGPGASMLDLSLFGVITLGVLGLFWIRRHTSEL